MKRQIEHPMNNSPCISPCEWKGKYKGQHEKKTLIGWNGSNIIDHNVKNYEHELSLAQMWTLYHRPKC